MLPGPCTISYALVGRIKWSDILVQSELAIMFRVDEEKSLQFALRVRSQALKDMKLVFGSFVDLEKAAFK